LGSGLAGLSSTELEARSQGQVRIVNYLAWEGRNHTIRSLLVFFRALCSHIAVPKRNTDMNGCRESRYRCQRGKKLKIEVAFAPPRLSDNISLIKVVQYVVRAA